MKDSNDKESLEIFLKEIKKLINKIVSKAQYDKTITATIIRKVEVGYVVSYGGKEYTIKSTYTYDVMDVVQVTLPCHSWENAYISSVENEINIVKNNLNTYKQLFGSSGYAGTISSDLNSILTHQKGQSFVIQPFPGSTTNSPTTDEGICMSFRNKNTNYGVQFILSNHHIYVRYYNDAAWGDWITLSSST